MPLDGSAQPRPKSVSLARGERRYKRKIASPKQWQAIIAQKQGPCRVCCEPAGNGHDNGTVQFHHVVARVHGGDDVPENIVPVHAGCHQGVTDRKPGYCEALLSSLTEAEYAFMVERGGEDYAERAYGLRYQR